MSEAKHKRSLSITVTNKPPMTRVIFLQSLDILTGEETLEEDKLTAETKIYQQILAIARR